MLHKAIRVNLHSCGERTGVGCMFEIVACHCDSNSYADLFCSRGVPRVDFQQAWWGTSKPGGGEMAVT